jgi:secreted PhoX family phosphatase
VSTTLHRSTFPTRTDPAAAGAVAGPLAALRARALAGDPTAGAGYGPLMDMGELALPHGFAYRVVSREGDLLGDGGRTPGAFGAMAAFPGPRGTTVLVRNHGHRRGSGDAAVEVPPALRYDPDPAHGGGCTQLLVGRRQSVLTSAAVLGGVSANRAGGPTPWRGWMTCEQVVDEGETGVRHGYVFEVDARSWEPGTAAPIVAAGRFAHGAVAWHGGVLYQTERGRGDACLYRYLPERLPRRAGDLAASTGKLQALGVIGAPNATTTGDWPVGVPFPVSWVDIDEPDPAADTVHAQAAARGAASLGRQQGCRIADGRVYVWCAGSGPAGPGQVWELDPRAHTLTLVHRSPGAREPRSPEDIVVTPAGDLLLCEQADAPGRLRLLGARGELSDLARAVDAPGSPFRGACFDPTGRVLYVSQRGDRGEPGGRVRARTYAIQGPWATPGAGGPGR